MTQTPDTPPRTPRRRAHKIGLWSLAGVGLASVAGVLLVLVIVGQTMTAPLWLRERIAMRIEQSLGTMQVAFGDVEMVIHKGWRPRVRLRDLVLCQDSGEELLRLSDAEASLSMRALLRGQVRPKQIFLSGAFATLQRGPDGAVALSLGDTPAPLEQASGLPQLIQTLDQVVQHPLLQSLTVIEMDALTLRYEDLRAGRAWTVDGGRAVMERSGDDLRLAGSFSVLGGGATASTLEINYTSRIGDAEAAFGFVVQDIRARDIAVQSPVLAWLDVLRAPISGALRGSVGGNGAVGPLSATLQIGKGVLQPNDQTRPIPFDGARTYFTYDPADQALVFDEISLASGWGTGIAEGTAQLGGIETGVLSDLVGQFTLQDLSINPDGLYDQPLDIARATADFRLDLNPFRVTLGEMQIADGDSIVTLFGTLAAEAEGWNLAMDGRMDALTPPRLLELWPTRAAPKPREWVVKNLHGAALSDINFALRALPGGRPDVYLDFGYSEAEITFQKHMPPMIRAAGQATMLGKRFVATASAGQVDTGTHGTVDVAGSSFIIPDMASRPAGLAVARVRATGPVAAIMALLNRPPLSVLKGTTLPVDLASGTAQATGTLSLPMKPKVQFEEMEFHVDGTLQNVRSTVLVPGQVATADEIQVRVTNQQVELRGPARIGDVPADVIWRQPIGPGAPRASRVSGKIELSARLIDTFRIGLPKNSVFGQGQANFAIDLGDGVAPRLTLESNLGGVGLRIPPLGWSKPERGTGRLNLTASLGDTPRVDQMTVSAAGLTAVGTVTTRPDGGLGRASFSSVRLGDWLSAPVELIGRGAGQAPELRVGGGRMDMRGASFGSGGSGDASGMRVALDRLQVTDTIALTGFEGTFNGTGGLNGTFTGRLNGQTPVTGEMVPQGGRSAFRIRASDAGGVFRDAGLLTRAHGGDFTMTLTPVEQPGEYDGVVRVTNTRVKNAPAIAALLNAASIVGLLDEMSGGGIFFLEVDARFRLAPDMVTLYSSSAVGPSMGLSMDGRYDVARNRLNMQGVISPIYLINGIGRVLARKGEGIIGFNYALRGPAASPSVQVNPLSALTPGLLRDVFRTAPPPVDPNAPRPAGSRARAPDATDGSTGGR